MIDIQQTEGQMLSEINASGSTLAQCMKDSGRPVAMGLLVWGKRSSDLMPVLEAAFSTQFSGMQCQLFKASCTSVSCFERYCIR